MLFAEQDDWASLNHECLYPAQEINSNDQTRLKKKELFEKVKDSEKKMYIERNEPFIFADDQILSEEDDGSLFTNFWIAIRDNDDKEKIVGLIGL